MHELTLQVPDGLLIRLQTAARHQHISLADLVLEVIEDYLDDYQDDEPTKAEILEGLRAGMRDALAGRTRPAHEILDEVRRALVLQPHIHEISLNSVILKVLYQAKNSVTMQFQKRPYSKCGCSTRGRCQRQLAALIVFGKSLSLSPGNIPPLHSRE